MVTNKEKKLAIILLKERLERLTGKEVVLKEGYEESLRRIISSKLKKIAVKGISPTTFLKAVDVLVEWYLNEFAELSELEDPGFDLQNDIRELLDASSDPEQKKNVAEVIGETFLDPDSDD